MLGLMAFFLVKDSFGHNDGNFIIVAGVFGGLWLTFYLGDCTNPNYSVVVAWQAMPPCDYVAKAVEVLF